MANPTTSKAEITMPNPFSWYRLDSLFARLGSNSVSDVTLEVTEGIIILILISLNRTLNINTLRDD